MNHELCLHFMQGALNVSVSRNSFVDLGLILQHCCCTGLSDDHTATVKWSYFTECLESLYEYV